MQSWDIWYANVYPVVVDYQYFFLAEFYNTVILNGNNGAVLYTIKYGKFKVKPKWNLLIQVNFFFFKISLSNSINTRSIFYVCGVYYNTKCLYFYLKVNASLFIHPGFFNAFSHFHTD